MRFSQVFVAGDATAVICTWILRVFRALIVVGAVFTFENYVRCASAWTLADAVFSQRFQVRLIAKAGRITETRHALLSAQQIANKVAS